MEGTIAILRDWIWGPMPLVNRSWGVATTTASPSSSTSRHSSHVVEKIHRLLDALQESCRRYRPVIAILAILYVIRYWRSLKQQTLPQSRPSAGDSVAAVVEDATARRSCTPLPCTSPSPVPPSPSYRKMVTSDGALLQVADSEVMKQLLEDGTEALVLVSRNGSFIEVREATTADSWDVKKHYETLIDYYVSRERERQESEKNGDGK